jgi:signal peptidase I
LSSSSNTSRAIFYVVVILVVVAGASFLINDRVGGIQVYNVYPTNSMDPTLEVGDLVVVHSVPFSSIHPGVVIVFARPDPTGVCTSEVIVHRVVNITAQGLITQGDNRFTNSVPDEGPPANEWPPVPADCVRGEVMFALPYLGQISEAFPPPLNYILVAIILVIIFLIEVVGSSRKEQPAAATEASSQPAKSTVLDT